MQRIDPTSACVCRCGHEHTAGRIGSCSKFTCPCNEWQPPEEGGDRSVSPRPESAQPEGVVEGVAAGSPPSSGDSAAHTESREADKIAADFAAISFPEHEARKLAFAYLRLRSVEEAALTFLDLFDADALNLTYPEGRTVPSWGIPQLREALDAVEWNEGDVADDAAEAFRWGFTPDGREPEDAGREQ